MSEPKLDNRTLLIISNDSHNITFISTVHKAIGKSNTDGLYHIINKISPDVIFLEALDETYSKYERTIFSSFGVYHKKLEISAIQRCSINTSFAYVPVLDSGLPDSFENKYSIVCKNLEWQKLIENFNRLAGEYRFEFLNNREGITLQEEMRILENRLLDGKEVAKSANADIEAYENSMMHNICSYSKSHKFDSAVFMCGVAHTKSICEKPHNHKVKQEVNLNWKALEMLK